MIIVLINITLTKRLFYYKYHILKLFNYGASAPVCFWTLGAANQLTQNQSHDLMFQRALLGHRGLQTRKQELLSVIFS